MVCRVPQESILGPLRFNINICDMFFEKYKCGIASYADDNKPQTCNSDFYTVLKKLENFTNNLCTWFQENHINMVICVTSWSQLKNQLVSTLMETVQKIKRNKNYWVQNLIYLRLSKVTLQLSVKNLVKNYMY